MVPLKYNVKLAVENGENWNLFTLENHLLREFHQICSAKQVNYKIIEQWYNFPIAKALGTIVYVSSVLIKVLNEFNSLRI